MIYNINSFHVLAGIGLNIDNEKPTTCLNAVLRELCVGAYQFSRQEVLAAFFNKFEKFYDLFINQGKYVLNNCYNVFSINSMSLQWSMCHFLC